MGRSRKVTGPFSTTWASTCSKAAASCFSAPADGTSAPDISGCSISVMASRSSRCITRRISIGAASACSISGRCSGATAGRWPGRISRRAPTRSSRANGHGARDGGPGHACWRTARARWRARRRRGSGRGAGAAATASAHPIPAQEAAQVSANWPRGSCRVRMSPYMVQAQQQWAVTPVANAGGYPGSRTSRSPSPAPTARSRPRPRGSRRGARLHRRTRTAVADRPAH